MKPSTSARCALKTKRLFVHQSDGGWGVSLSFTRQRDDGFKFDICECRPRYQSLNRTITLVVGGATLSDLADVGRLENLIERLDSKHATPGGSSCSQN